MESAKLHIGTSGWSYKHWTKIFYPKDIKPDKYLEYYITRFSCAELNYGIIFVIADSADRYTYYETITADEVYLSFYGR